ncbi:ImmA/IrrE family metallo-endopeptidase [Flexivirga caeni]|uniref:ImmA/IrrE family metallo-endopeptidase n=1 Tax=Flexivirga caeni TaxID=2294115 RepID=A0A3M9M5D6_9MICO|nr:ImmA/IrrE family metallo-endopeptidase [Flexivirga caeni]RNI20716.1 ImmA/IrrE family metallo-endopeptidase [Flexivirga caeni]
MNHTSSHQPSTLTSLRALIPQCRLDFDDTKAVAERQATRLLELLGSQHDGIHEHHLAALPRLRIVREPLPTSGLSYWNGREWIIALNESDGTARQRFTLLHEFKHIIDHGAHHRLYASEWEAERAADYFAACTLMPKPELKRVFCNITQRIDQLATYFGVSQQAIRVRLEQTGLVDSEKFTRQRCARPISTPRWQAQRFRTVQMKGSTA